MQHAEIYSYFVPIFDGRTEGQTLNPSWSGVTRGYLPVLLSKAIIHYNVIVDC